jgi:hypothetical protein
MHLVERPHHQRTKILVPILQGVLKGAIYQGQEAKANPGAPKGQLGSEAPIHGGQAWGSLKLRFQLPFQVALTLKHGA